MIDFLVQLFWSFLVGFTLVFGGYRVWLITGLHRRRRRKAVKVVMLQPVYLDGERVAPPGERGAP